MYRIFSFFLALTFSATAFADDLVRGFSLTELGEHRYDASEDPTNKTEAQNIVDKLFDLGVRQINLSPRALMYHPRSSELVPKVISEAQTNPVVAQTERQRYLRLIKYIKSKGMKVGMRPIFFVVNDQGNTPYEEILPNGTKKIWWHGNIQPDDPNAWFQSYRTYLARYLAIAKVGKVDEFTIGAELYSMTVGIEDQWLSHPHGFPGRWLELLNFARTKLPKDTRIMYDINFTDDSLHAGGIVQWGGEFARWHYRLVDLADPNDPNWLNLKDFWTSLDAVGIDMYRSLATDAMTIPENPVKLTEMLQKTSDRYAAQIDNALFDIESEVGSSQILILKEIGFRSIERGFIRPFEYAGTGSGLLSIQHQASAYEAIFKSFWEPQWSWFKGIVFWDASIDENKHGTNDTGFSVLGKELTEDVIKTYY